MKFIVRNTAAQPIYEQIYAQIKSAIVSGELAEGDAVPSIRSLAKDLRISVITTKRAYDELEKDGYLCMVAGKGCYVAPKDTELLREQRLREIEDHLTKINELAAPLGLTEAALLAMYRAIAEEEAP
ncbi:MAG: GntR family transcriptional regulator [Oscillospiraceae bacterium]|nr:GntR family transcriptional regulator [Oscillospiraceae bacterium]